MASVSAKQFHEGPVQIITIADVESTDERGINRKSQKFSLAREKLDFVLSQVPPDLPVSVVSVVGAFRTGKSFLLDLFLRYLRHQDDDLRRGLTPEPFDPSSADGKASWLYDGGDRLEGNERGNAPDYAPAGAKPGERTGFKWRPGEQRCTTGIWLWSRPFVLQRPGPKGGNIAVLLMDTQGLWDHKSDQLCTACIFGLSTLVSSYLIYNVSNPAGIQEDNLQHIALFTEYARLAAAQEAAVRSDSADSVTDAARHAPVQRAHSALESLDRNSALERLHEASSPPVKGAAPHGSATHSGSAARRSNPPFQRLEFLLRDNANVSKFVDNPVAAGKHMSQYLESVFAQADFKDLRLVRQQILDCFQAVSCYMLVHPGEIVTEEPTFDGNVEQIRGKFRVMLERYVHIVFDQQLEPKRSPTGHALTALELGHFIQQYVTVFQEGTNFPPAQVLLMATAHANNLAAKDAALSRYSSVLSGLTDNNRAYVKEETLADEVAKAKAGALDLFDKRALFGPAKEISQFREELLLQLERLGTDALEANKVRHPWAAVVPYLFALYSMVFFYFCRVFLDFTCAPWAEVCERASSAAGFVSSSIFCGFLFLLWQSGAVTWDKINAVVGAASSAMQAGGGVTGLATAGASAAASHNTDKASTRAVSPSTRTTTSEDGHATSSPSRGLRRRKA